MLIDTIIYAIAIFISFWLGVVIEARFKALTKLNEKYHNFMELE